MNPQHLQIHVTVDPDNALQGAYGILLQVKPKWERQNICSQIFSNGITNKMFGFHHKDNKDHIILVRVNGNRTEIFLDREKEVKSFNLLSKHGCAPRLYCVFNNGLCYEYINGVTLNTKTIALPSVYELLIVELVKVHSIPSNGEMKPKPGSFPLMRKFLDIVFAPNGSSKKSLETADEEKALRNEVDTLEACLLPLNSPVVFCHNDLLLHNVIYSKDDAKVSLIDYEYAGFNFQAYDIGNHFCEFAGIDDVDYDLYPNKEFQFEWLECYVKTWAARNSPDVLLGNEEVKKRVETLYKQVNKFALAAHLSWGIWALVQAKYSQIDFDYRQYSKLRLDEYYRRKDQFLAL